MKRIYIIIGIIIVLVSTILIYKYFIRQHVEVISPTRKEALSALYATGVVHAENKVNLRTEVAGKVKIINARIGEEVWENSVVIELDAVAQAEAVKEQLGVVQESSASLNEAKANYSKELQLFNSDSLDTSNPSKVKNLNDAKIRLDRTNALAKTLQTSLQNRKRETGKGKIISPISGIITNLKTTIGEVLPQNYDVATIIDPLSFKVYANIDELDITRIQPGQEAILQFDAMPLMRFRARIDRIVPQIDERFKTITAILTLIDNVPNISEGMTSTLNIIEERKTDALVLPSTSLVNEVNKEAYVFIVKYNKQIEKRKIRIGIRGENYVEVIYGIKENEMVVLNSNENLVDGDYVDVHSLNVK